MKKFVLVILAVFYLSTSAGATLHLHYCMDQLVDWKLWSNETTEDICSSCGMLKTEATNNGCCRDEHKQIKLEDDHRAADGYKTTQLVSAIIHLALFQAPGIDLPGLSQEYPTSHTGQRSSGLAVYLRNHVFRI